MDHPILAFSQYLNLSEEDSNLRKFVTSLGRKFTLQKDGKDAFVCIRKQGIELRLTKEKWLVGKGDPFENIFRLTEIGFYADGYEKYTGYPEILLDGLTFDSSQKDVRTRLGKPKTSQKQKKFSGLVFNAWDKFELGECLVGVEYSEDKTSILQINLTLPQFWV